MGVFELSSEKYKNGRRPFTAILYELQPPECVVDDVGTKYNKNGITFLEEYCEKQLESIKDMSVTVEFIDDERTMICGHGNTGVEDGMPVFDNATTVGHFTDGYIDEVEIDGESKKCVLGKGFLDEMRYHSFVSNLETQLENGNSIDGSIEIYKSEGNDSIVYKKGYIPEGRIPTEFIHSGWAMVINPADTNSTLLELNSENQKEEQFNMTEQEIMDVVQKAITETNSVKAESEEKINELNTQIAEKDSKISELNATVEQVQKALDDLKKEQEGYWDERNALEKELGELRAAKRLGELNEAIEGYSEEEQKYAESEINAFKENPLEGNIDEICSKICVGIVTKQKEDAKIAEQNSAKETKPETIDIFGEINEVSEDDPEDSNIF